MYAQNREGITFNMCRLERSKVPAGGYLSVEKMATEQKFPDICHFQIDHPFIYYNTESGQDCLEFEGNKEIKKYTKMFKIGIGA